MKRILFFTFMILTAFSFSGCFGKSDKSKKSSSGGSVKKISQKEAKEIIDSEESYILLDVRTPEEFKEGHIEGAILIPDYELSGRAADELPDKDALILVYCRSGARSSASAKTLANMGYTNINDFGGIMSWPYDIVKD